MSVDHGTGGLDREQVRQVFVSIGRPLPRRHAVISDLMGAVSLVPGRTLALLMLLGLAVLLALSPAAWGAEAHGEPVQKGQGGVPRPSDNPLREIEFFSGPVAPNSLYNFLQIFPLRHVERPSAISPEISAKLRPAPAPAPERAARAGEPSKLLTALALIVLVLLWLHLRSTRDERPETRRSR